MKNYIITLKTLGPIHVGFGHKLSKNDYYLDNNSIYVINSSKFFSSLNSKEKEDYERHLLENSNKGLTEFIKSHNLIEKVNNFSKYKLSNYTLVKNAEVDQFVRDGHGIPYIPGSSLKGVLRTVILNYILKNDVEVCKTLEKESNVEDVYNLLMDKNNIDTNVMRYISISDSNLFTDDDMIFSQKYDLFAINDKEMRNKGKKENRLNIYKECLKPGIIISHKLSIDEERAKIRINGEWIKITKDLLIDMIKSYYIDYEKNYISMFKESVSVNKNIIYLGGASGFASKTIDYQLYGNLSIRQISKILDKQFPTKIDYNYKNKNLLVSQIKNAGFEPCFKKFNFYHKRKEDHRHWKDQEIGISPHTLKCTKYNNNMFEFGKCLVDITEVI